MKRRGCMLRLHECFEPIVPAIYVFGGSTVDVGTNHYLPQSRARADFPFNGIDFPHSRPTGRFSNGFNLVDYLANFLGFELSPPPFLPLLDENENGNIRLLTKGVNFASGGSELLNDTGKQKWGNVVAFGEQVEQFARVHDIISKLQGESGLAIYQSLASSSALEAMTSSNIFFLTILLLQKSSLPLSCPLMKVD